MNYLKLFFLKLQFKTSGKKLVSITDDKIAPNAPKG